MNKILIDNVMFYGFHGVYEYEREQGQKFYYDIEMYCNDITAAQTDDLNKGVDYIHVYQLVKDIAENKRFQLLEALTMHMADKILEACPVVAKAVVRVRKYGVPIAGPINFVQVESIRDRKAE